MPIAPGTLHLFLPLVLALALLLTGGVAALVYFATQRRTFSTPWKTLLSQLAATSPWRWPDLLNILLLIATAQVIRRSLSTSIAWDVLAFQGVLIAGLCWRARGKAQPFGSAAPVRAIAKHAFVRWLAVLPILWFAAFVWQFLLQIAGHTPDFQEAIRLFLDSDNPYNRVAFIFFAVVLAPIAEEGLFRGILLPLLIRRTGALAGLALTSLGFASLHVDLGTFVPLAIFSVALSLAYARTGTLWVPILMHALFNAANLALLLALAHAGVV